MTEKRAHVFIRGRVQGVSFRYYTVQEAQQRGVGGMVRNLPDGRVEAVFQGPEQDVQYMLNWCQHGSPAASVDHVEVSWEEPRDDARGFNVRY